ncbi:tRNA (cytidine(34)-2'-O)-methyltransferase [Acuticoccus mangrovi]|uniref:tRNA (cytidine(34)-2'-O)-methyltransferase n=1 Tax=Acuticoccus mangrovi TaxID=2796142 RepID=A0A934IEX7_9HYPH|nr:tRNA (cytidine(34)-2'-O)-methyltransferase [Acuticoccus mangrovi]MBJ3775369.1 tRNA (cytidine(34)-2'-O)-methyltransferase [Acuticoccus mangrovi]
MDLALYEPDIPQNTAAILRTAFCLGARVHIVGPAGFDLSDRAMRRAGLDYAPRVPLLRHPTFEAFQAVAGRIVLFTTRATTPLTAFAFTAGDTLLFGRESAGVPEAVHALCPHTVRIPIVGDARSLNLAVAVGIGLFEAVRQTGGISPEGTP